MVTRALDSLIKEIEKKKPGRLKLASEFDYLKVERLTTGSLALDVETGGGWIKGSINEVYGDFSSGKTFLLYKTIAENQKRYPDANFALILFEDMDKDWAETCGVDLDRLYLCDPGYMEDGLDVAEALLKSRQFMIIAIDSWGAMCPKKEYDAEMEANTMALRARIGNKFIRKVAGVNPGGDNIGLGDTTLIIVNQMTTFFGPTMSWDIPVSNRAINFLGRLLIRFKLNQTDSVHDTKNGQRIVQCTDFIIDKNKTRAPKNKGHFFFNLKDNPKGKAGQIQLAEEIATYATVAGIIKKGGAWYTLPEAFGGERFQGKPGLVEWLDNHPEHFQELQELTLSELYRMENEESVVKNEEQEEVNGDNEDDW